MHIELGIRVLLAVILGSTLIFGEHPHISIAQNAIRFDIVYVRQPRHGDNQHIVWPEVFHPSHLEPGADLLLLHPSGAEEVLIAGGNGAVSDPFVSFDAQWVYYSFFHDQRPDQLNHQRDDLPYAGADIYRINLGTRQIQQLTHQEFTPNTGSGKWDESNPVDPANATLNRLGYGILNTGPTPLAGGKIMFTSNRNGFIPPKGYTNPTLQLFVMDEDGSNVTPIAPMTNASALHPVQLKDGRVMFSSAESQGLRDSRMWGLWAIWPDGRVWEPLISAFKWADALHFATQLSGGDIVVEDYYNLNNWGFGALYRFPSEVPAGEAKFHSAVLAENPPLSQTLVFASGPEIYPRRMHFSPRGLHSITPLTNAEDQAAPLVNGEYRGKFTHPAAAPNNDLLVVWSPGPVNALNRPVNLPAVDAGLYLIHGGDPVNLVSDLTLIKNDPNYNEVWPRPVVPYQALYGIDQPFEFSWLPNNGSVHSELPAGTPYGLVGTSSLYKRESAPGYATDNKFDGLDAFNSSINDGYSNWFTQGADAGKYNNSDIWAIRLLAMEPNAHRSYGPHEGQHFFNHANEKLRILGEIPVRKFDGSGNPILDTEGNPDTSFLAKIPADTPFTFQMLDRNGMLLTMAQTWHQVRPGEMRADCGGCHAHSQQPLNFAQTAAGKPGYAVLDLAKTTPLLTHDSGDLPSLRTITQSAVNIEFYRDIRPILQRSCSGCHTAGQASPPGNLVLDDLALYDGPAFSGMKLPGDYARLCFDEGARWGDPPLVKVGSQPVWRNFNASRYVRPFQSRRSLLLWKIYGARLDGWSNADHPTEATPGDAGTLPAGAQINDADLDYVGSSMPPSGSGYPALSADEKMNVARWVDLGCPINADENGPDKDFGWYIDDQRPTLAVSSPRPGRSAQALSLIRLGVADAYSGILSGSLSLSATIPLAGRPAGTELVDLAQTNGADGIYALTLTTPITFAVGATLHAAVKDQQGNITRVSQTFSVLAGPMLRVYLPVSLR